MKKAVSLFVIFLFGVGALKSQAQGNTLLWKISGNDLEQPSYLYGTYHLLCPDDLQFSETVKNAVNQSSQVVLELDFDDPGIMQELQKGMFLDGGKTAKDYLDEDQFALVSDFFTNEMNMPFKRLSAVKPFFLSSMTVAYYLDCQPASPEMQFANLAGEQKKEVIGLETVEEQIGFIDGIPLEDAAKMLVMGIEDRDEMDAMTDEMVATYLRGDINKIQAIIDDYMADDYSDINHELIVSRNEAWIPKIVEIIGETPSFIAFGAGHLPGEKGVIELLRKEGYTVDPVH